MCIKRLTLTTVVLLSLFGFIPATWAGGFLIYEHGATATGMASARSAMADDLSALYFNPAAVTELPGLQLELGVTGILPFLSYSAAKQPSTRTYVGLNGTALPVNDGQNDVDARLKGFTPIHIYASYQILDTGLVVSYALNNPFGLGTYYPKDWDGQFIATETELKTFFNQVAVSADLAKMFGFKDKIKLSVAAGLDVAYGTAWLAQNIDLRGLNGIMASQFNRNAPDPKGEVSLSGSSWGLGYNFALYSELPDLLAFGASVRSNVAMNFSGTANFRFNENGTIANQSPLLGIPSSTKGSVEIVMPIQLNFGLAFLGVKNLKIEFDVFAALFQSYDKLDIKFDCGATACPSALSKDPIKKNFGTSWQFALGAEYQIAEGWYVRAGYGLITSPIPDSTLSPELPDGRRDLICVGAGYRGSWWKADIGNMVALWKVTKNNDAGGADATGNPNGKANGTYTTKADLLAFTYSMWF